ncbi:MAG: type II CAAX endopeptidase family protein [Lachnospiraceae bacterium]|nr:type II CAAX endopeptidase family protein [Lachnospiraceae bacterium]
MEKIKTYLYKDIGIILCIIFYICFVAIAYAVKPYLDGADWYFFSSLQRIIFGLAELAIFIKVFHKEKWRDVINFRHFKDGIRAGSGVILYTILLTIVIAIGIGSLVNTTFAILFSCLICQQITTGFWEELTFRAFVLEGYFNKTKKSWWCRLAYACISFIIFGLVHAIEYDNFGDAIDVFIMTGIFGFVCAAIYLYSHNILVPMLLHFIYDIPANFQQFVDVWNEEGQLFQVLNNYVLTAVFLLMPIAAFVFVIKKPVYEQENTVQISGTDGPTSVFIVGCMHKPSLSQRVQRIPFRTRKAWYEKHITADGHTMEEVRQYIRDVYGFQEVNPQSEEYQLQYKEIRASFIMQYAPELLGEYADAPQMNGTDEASIKHFMEQNELRQQAAERIAKEEFDIELYIYKKDDNDTHIDFVLESKYGYIGGGATGSKAAIRKYERMYRDVYQYYGVTKEDIEHRTKRYEDLIRTLARR